jgi:hypothetical protein
MGKDGQVPPTNGWTFWKLRDSDGKDVEIAVVRDRHSTRQQATG